MLSKNTFSTLCVILVVGLLDSRNKITVNIICYQDSYCYKQGTIANLKISFAIYLLISHFYCLDKLQLSGKSNPLNFLLKLVCFPFHLKPGGVTSGEMVKVLFQYSQEYMH